MWVSHRNTGRNQSRLFKKLSKRQIEKKLKENIPNKILLVAEAMRKKIKLKRIYNLSKIDLWFLNQIKEIIENEIKIKNNGLPKNFDDYSKAYVPYMDETGLQMSLNIECKK